MITYLDFSTAESALQSIAEAYRRKDIEAAVACKDFRVEAQLMLERLGQDDHDQELIAQAAEVLELSFRSHTLQCWPDFSCVRSTVSSLIPHREGVYIATETGTFNGEPYQQDIFMCYSDSGWRVLNPVPARDTP